jgi:hypothetical protein
MKDFWLVAEDLIFLELELQELPNGFSHSRLCFGPATSSPTRSNLLLAGYAVRGLSVDRPGARFGAIC